MLDAFVSYAHRDKEAVRLMVNRLRQSGLAVWFDETGIEDLAHVARSIQQGLANARVLVAFYSTVYPTRRACQWELTAAYVADPRRVIAINPESSVQHILPNTLLEMKLPGPDSPHLESSIWSRVREFTDCFPRLQLALPQWFGMAPLGSTRFIGRHLDLWRVHSLLFDDGVGKVRRGVAQVTGLGGSGKSLLAEEYARRFGSAFPGGVFWLRADSDLGPDQREQCDRQIRSFAESLGLPIAKANAIQVRGRLARAMAKRGPSLWIVDDLPTGLDRNAFEQWLAPDSLARTLITTRSRGYRNLSDSHDLEMLEPEEAYELLTSSLVKPSTDSEVQAARDVCGALGCLPLALDVARARIEYSGASKPFTFFHRDLSSPEEDALELAAQFAELLPTGHEASVASTLLRSIRHLPPEGMDLLRLAAILAEAPIPSKLIVAVFQSLRTSEDGDLQASLAIKCVERLSLAKRDGSALSVHALVRRTVLAKEAKEPGGIFSDLLGAFARIKYHAPGALLSLIDESDVDDIRIHPHIEPLVVHAQFLISTDPDVLYRVKNLVNRIARYEHVRGNYQTAQMLYKQALKEYERLGKDVSSFLTVSRLTSVLRDKGEFADARSLLERETKSCRRRYGRGHRMTCILVNELALTLFEQGEFATARKLQKQNLRIELKQRGEHRDTLATMGNLALTLQAAGDLDGSRQLQIQLMEMSRRILGHRDPQTLSCMNNLATTLVLSGDLDSARHLLQEELELSTAINGPEHADTLTSMNNLALTLYSLNDLARARTLLEQSLEKRIRINGSTHVDTLTTRNNLGRVLRRQGEVQQAQEIHEEVLMARIDLLGEEHPDTCVSALDLARDLSLSGINRAPQSPLADISWFRRDSSTLRADQLEVRDVVQALWAGNEPSRAQ